jgi:hypothetical protein
MDKENVVYKNIGQSSSGKTHAKQARGPEFDLQYHKKEDVVYG